MSGGRGPREKGSRFERELVQTAVDSKIPAQRAWGSNGEALGLPADVDCLIAGKRVQAKRRASVAGWLIPADGIDAVAFRPDYGEAMVCISYSDWLDLLKAKEASDEL
jgi:hypothetical protein